uniref:Uncharacterized protein n=1 Tax=Schistocephalus solidus TaxID=70667 RepID=A0A0X3PCX6_SCHSO
MRTTLRDLSLSMQNESVLKLPWHPNSAHLESYHSTRYFCPCTTNGICVTLLTRQRMLSLTSTMDRVRVKLACSRVTFYTLIYPLCPELGSVLRSCQKIIYKSSKCKVTVSIGPLCMFSWANFNPKI